jgi:hypothetical protein
LKSFLLVCSVLLTLSSNLYGISSYRQGHYVSKSHLHNIFKRVKHTSSVSQKALARTFAYYEKNRYKKHLSPDYIAIADYTKKATQKRLYIINLHTGKVYRHLLAHGINSGSRNGRVLRSSNVKDSHMTPYGFFKIGSREGRTYRKRYKYLSVKGLQRSNRKVGWSTRRGGRDVLLHTASYVNWRGRSYGCFAIRPQDKWKVFPKLKRALFYSYTGR